VKDDWMSFPIPADGETWLRASSIVQVTTITALSIGQEKVAREMERQAFVSEHPQAEEEIPEVARNPGFQELKQSKTSIGYVPNVPGTAFDGVFKAYTTQDVETVMRRVRVMEGRTLEGESS